MASEHPPSSNGSGSRQCPTPNGETRALITHTIPVPTCLARQRDFYHKCHRCVYRGKPAAFVFEAEREAAAPESR